MQIVFDMAYDQKVAPSGIQAGQAKIGELNVGIQGLIQLLETHLGMTGRDIHHAMRIQGYMQTMQGLSDKEDAAFFKKSLESDAWSSAKQMLDWRDALVLAGWTGKLDSSFSDKLKALALLENAFPDDLKNGLGDRLQRILKSLDSSPHIHIESISTFDALDSFPFLVTQTLKKLQSLGVGVSHIQFNYVKAEGNLGCIQQAMLGKSVDCNVKQGDDSILLLSPEDEWVAANTLAAWLKSEEESNANVLLIQGDGSDILDQALQKSALPMLGNAERSAFRSALQIMPLAIANAWSPLNIQDLLSFLALPVSPVPRFAALKLMDAIQSEPGVGGERWLKAEEKIIEVKKAKLIDEGISEDNADLEAQAFMQRLNHYLTDLKFDSKAGIPPQALIEICEWVKQGLKSPTLKQSMSQALGQVDSMIALANEYQQPIPRAQVERMLDSVIAEGGQNPDSHTQASSWQSVSSTGGIAAPIETVIWWDFSDKGQSSLAFWSKGERDALSKLDVYLEAPASIRSREAEQWRRAALLAEKRLILIAPQRLNGEQVQLHPFWDEIRYHAVTPQDSDSEKEMKYHCLQWQGESFNALSSFELAGRVINLKSETSASLAEPEQTVALDKGSISKPKHLSFSQMSTMLGCPTKWAMQYHARLSSMASLSLPTGNTMIGSLCHKIVEDLYTDESKWNVSNVRSYTSSLFDIRVPQMAAELLQPGRELEKERYRISVCDAVDALLQTVDQAGLKVTKTEGKVEGKDLDGIPFKGYIDLQLEDEQGDVFVIDLKWSGSDRYKKEEIKDGKALQLASYAWMLKSADDRWAPGAYFMLAQGELLTDDPRFKTAQVINSPQSAKEVWMQGSLTWRSMFNTAENGELEVAGLWDDKELEDVRSEAGLMHVKPPCHFCDFGKLCGKTRAEA